MTQRPNWTPSKGWPLLLDGLTPNGRLFSSLALWSWPSKPWTHPASRGGLGLPESPGGHPADACLEPRAYHWKIQEIQFGPDYHPTIPGWPGSGFSGMYTLVMSNLNQRTDCRGHYVWPLHGHIALWAQEFGVLSSASRVGGCCHLNGTVCGRWSWVVSDPEGLEEERQLPRWRQPQGQRSRTWGKAWL